MKLNVDLVKNSYNIIFSDSFNSLPDEMLGINAPKKVLIVTDTNVEKLYLNEVLTLLKANGYDVLSHSIKAGEENKNMQSTLDICAACVKHNMDRKSLIVALGGGVVGDMAGFAASIYMRGIDFIQIPTTLLSQSDSSVGGKTGIDFEGGKNLLGAFHQPRLVYVNVNTLKTLPHEQFVSGMGEVIKHGIISNYSFFEYIKTNSDKIKALDSKTLMELTYKNCSIKADIVSKDEKEMGLRANLNFGHTIGHAIESAFDFKMTHGECVGLGMLGAAYIACKRGLIRDEQLTQIKETLEIYGFSTRVALPSFDIIHTYMQKDKKKTADGLKFVLPTSIGSVEHFTDVCVSEIDNALNYLQKI